MSFKTFYSMAAAALIVMSLHVSADDEKTLRAIYRIKYDTLDWDAICPNIKPVSYKGCDRVHPASVFFSKDPTLYYDKHGTTHENYKLDCVKQSAYYDRLTTPKKHPITKWLSCENAMSTAAHNRMINYTIYKKGKQEYYYDELPSEWVARYLNITFE